MRVNGDERRQGNTVFQAQQDWYTYELTETLDAHTGSAQV